MATERMSYDGLKHSFLENYFSTCRDHRTHGKLTLDEIILDVHEELSDSFPSPIENLMVNVIGLALTGGWFPDLEDHCRTRIERILLSHRLEAVLKSLSPREKEEFMRDLRLLKVI